MLQQGGGWHVRAMAEIAAERTLHARLDATRDAMLRRGLAPEVVAREARSLELAIRTRLWAVVIQRGDVA